MKPPSKNNPALKQSTARLNKLVAARNKAISRRVNIRLATEDKLAAVNKKIQPLLKQTNLLNRHLEELGKTPLAEAVALDALVRQMSLTPTAYGFNNPQEILDLIAPTE
jgi:phage-related tail protein